jgi:hypothetical protein
VPTSLHTVKWSTSRGGYMCVDGCFCLVAGPTVRGITPAVSSHKHVGPSGGLGHGVLHSGVDAAVALVASTLQEMEIRYVCPLELCPGAVTCTCSVSRHA